MPRPFDHRVFRQALDRFATGVIVLTAGPRKAPHGMTANAFMSGSLEPPLVVVPGGRHARMHARLAGARRFGVSILDQGQEPASRHFAGQTVAGFAPPFTDLGGVPVLAEAAVTLAARIKHCYDCGDHTLFVGEVQKLAVHETAPPLLFFEGRYGMFQPSHQRPGRSSEPYPSFF